MNDQPQSTIRVIANFYNQQSASEWQRLERHRTEYAVTLKALEAYLPPPPGSLLDCGGGPGRYAIELARRGYQVTLFDLSSGNLKFAREKAGEAGVTLAGYEQGTATDLSRFAEGSFDAVLLMGPLYHLPERAARLAALEEAKRVVKPGGRIFAAFIGRYAPFRYAAAEDPGWLVKNAEEARSVLETGSCSPEQWQTPGFHAYFTHPGEVQPLFQEARLELAVVLAVEGLVSRSGEQTFNEIDRPAWEAWVELNYRLASDASIHGAVEHLLAVACKPRWRVALRQIAQRLEQAGIKYKVVGGTSAALHGAPIQVKDIDIETSAQDAYRFGALFHAGAIQPVALSESESYRSHFGKFVIEGVPVEVMGDLHRKEGDLWKPTFTRTETQADLDGCAVSVSWLEEEVLAYLRRGRLERAGQCLQFCDQGRLLALLRGDVENGVL